MKTTNNSHRSGLLRGKQGLLAAAVVFAATAGNASAAAYVDDLAGNHCTGKVTCSTCSMAAYDLVQELVGTGITVSNATITGAQRAFGRYTSDSTAAFGFTKGIVLSTGFATNVLGPNESAQITGSNYQPGDATLSLMAGADTYDAAVLEFDFVPNANVFSFEYTFASDEYNEYANSAFNDVFAFYVNGNDAAHDVAFIPGTQVPVSINDVNGGNPFGFGAHHGELFRNNAVADGAGTIPTEMDGITTVLSAQARVTPNAVNHIKIAIADVADQYYDSNVIIKAGSFSATCIHFDALGACDAVSPGLVASPLEAKVAVNTPPVALCKTVYADVDASCNACASVDAGSYDPDGETVTCVQANQCFGPGTHTTTLTCTDSHGLTASCVGTVIVADELPPTLVCPANSTAECSVKGPQVAMPNGTALCGASVVTSCVGPPNGYFGYGLDAVTCTATDCYGNGSTCSFTVNVVDTLPPVVTPKADAAGVSAYLWPPDHIYWTVSLADCVASATDRCVGDLSLAKAGSFVRAYSSESEDVGRGGDGHTCNDIVFVDNQTVQLRAERQGGNSHTGRVYHLGYKIADGHGNAASGTCVVAVAHDQSGIRPGNDICAGKPPGPDCDAVAPHAGAYCVPGPGQTPGVCSGYGALHKLSCNF